MTQLLQEITVNGQLVKIEFTDEFGGSGYVLFSNDEIDHSQNITHGIRIDRDKDGHIVGIDIT